MTRLLDTNLTQDEFAHMLERLPDGVTRLRRELRISDPDLVDEWLSQVDWIIDITQPAIDSMRGAMKWRCIRALVRVIVPMWLLLFALSFPRLSAKVGLS